MFEAVTPEGIQQRILDKLGSGIDTREGSFASDIVAPAALEIWKIYAALNELIPIAYPDETSGEYIDKKCGYYGITRKEGTKAEVTLTITGTDGKVVPSGTAFLNAENLKFTTAADAEISNGSAEVTATAENVGTAYNVAAGEIDHPLTSVSGVTAVTNKALAAGGTDPESDKSLLARLYDRLREPATSGNVYHYRKWALECEGVGAVKVFPLWSGAGTVKVLVASPEMEPVDSEVVAAAQNYIEEQRPIGAQVTVATVSALQISVTADILLDGTVTLAEAEQKFGAALEEYFKGIAFSSYTIPYTRIGYLLAGTDGVADYSNLLVNGGTENITVGEEQIPKKGEVVLNESA